MGYVPGLQWGSGLVSELLWVPDQFQELRYVPETVRGSVPGQVWVLDQFQKLGYVLGPISVNQFIELVKSWGSVPGPVLV